MPKQIKYILCCFLIANLFYSCFGTKDCGSFTYPGIGDAYNKWIHYRSGDTIRYVNSLNYEIIFVVKESSIADKKILDCWHQELGGCICAGYTETSSFNGTTNDTSWKVNSGTIYSQDNNYFDAYIDLTTNDNLRYRVLDNLTSLTVVGDTFKLDAQFHKILPTFTVNTKTYSNVILQEYDTAIYKYTQVYKTYFNRENGIIAFEDRRTHSLFYKK